MESPVFNTSRPSLAKLCLGEKDGNGGESSYLVWTAKLCWRQQGGAAAPVAPDNSSASSGGAQDAIGSEIKNK